MVIVGKIQIFLFLFLAIFTKSQINISVKNNTHQNFFFIDITETKKHYILKLKIRDSISKIYYEFSNENFSAELLNFKDKTIKNDSVISLLTKYKNLEEKNTYYSEFKTKVSKNRNQKFQNLIEIFKIYDKEYFERKIDKNKIRLIIHGTFVNIKIRKKNNTTEEIFVHGPFEVDYPEIRKLINMSLNYSKFKHKKLRNNINLHKF